LVESSSLLAVSSAQRQQRQKRSSLLGSTAAAGEVPPAVPVEFELGIVIGGKDSKSEAPKDEEGLNALSPLNPVV